MDKDFYTCYDFKSTENVWRFSFPFTSMWQNKANPQFPIQLSTNKNDPSYLRALLPSFLSFNLSLAFLSFILIQYCQSHLPDLQSPLSLSHIVYDKRQGQRKIGFIKIHTYATQSNMTKIKFRRSIKGKISVLRNIMKCIPFTTTKI